MQGHEYRPSRSDYFVEGSSGRVQLGTSELERDLGVMVSFDCRWRNQVNAAASKANRVLGMMRNTFRFWTDDIARMIYPTSSGVRVIGLEPLQ